MLRKFIFLGLLILLGCSDKPTMIPNSLGKLNLDKYYVGAKAKEMINQLHMSGMVAGDKNEIGFYSHDTLKEVLYISKFKDSKIAEQKLEQMLIKIAHGSTPFFLHNQVNVQNTNIFLLFGMGQSHYVYTKNDKLIWLSVDFQVSLETLHSLLKQIR
ncbi:hypothetical protein [Candidatus Kryptonium thompsonii]|uniref:hypothetical protein n=1 Tax=Candidatus Kryptonium thompsonii TaxID=1633631 RepID=UPI000707610A|nr:hypothetical protein [Candidatus Kryptonium thompsoni]CUS93535.1 hypothetical protein JGI15_10956 [Candidatus Kryptonium thompsoni]